MTRAEAEAQCRRLAEESAERDTHQWMPREGEGGDWTVVKIALPPATEPSGTETRADERPATADDPRPATEQNVPPWSVSI